MAQIPKRTSVLSRTVGKRPGAGAGGGGGGGAGNDGAALLLSVTPSVKTSKRCTLRVPSSSIYRKLRVYKYINRLSSTAASL
jgi:hypothetical protein